MPPQENANSQDQAGRQPFDTGAPPVGPPPPPGSTIIQPGTSQPTPAPQAPAAPVTEEAPPTAPPEPEAEELVRTPPEVQAGPAPTGEQAAVTPLTGAAPVSATSGTAAPPEPPAPNQPSTPPPRNFLRKFTSRTSIYAWIFAASIILVGLVIYAFAFKPNSGKGSNQHVSSLTDAQIAQLKNNATLVGSPKTTLDVQSNAIFDNQVLLRNDLSVAGAIKSGGAGTFQSITVGTTGDFNDVHVNNTLGILGTSTFQGQVNIQKNLVVTGSTSLGTVTASQLTVGSLTLNGDILVTHHITTNGSIPGKSGGTALGSGGTASLSGTDTAGSITLSTGSGTAAGILINVTFTTPFASTPHVVITPIGSSAAGLPYYVNRSTTGFSIGVTSAPSPGLNFGFDYVVFD